DGADVSGTAFQRRGNRRIIEFWVVGPDHVVGRAVHRQVLQHLVRPGMDVPAGLWKSLAIRKFRPGIDDRDAETEPIGEAGQRDRDVRSPEDEELRRPRERLQERTIATNRTLVLE